jgi:hypothetical protein
MLAAMARDLRAPGGGRRAANGLLGLAVVTTALPAPVSRGAQPAAPPIVVPVRVEALGGTGQGESRSGDFLVTIDGVPVPADRIAFRPPAAAGSRRIVLAVHQPSLAPADARAAVESLGTFGTGPAGTDRLAVWPLPASATQLLFTAERNPIAIQLGRLRGTRAQAGRYPLSPGQAAAIAAGDVATLERVTERECPRGESPMAGLPEREVAARDERARCRDEIAREAGAVAEQGRVDAEALLRDLGPLIDTLGRLQGPRHLVLLTGPLALADASLDASVRRLAVQAASTGLLVHAVQLARTADPERGGVSGAEREPAGLSAARQTGGVATTGSDPRRPLAAVTRAIASDGALLLSLDAGLRDGAVHDIRVTFARPGHVRVEAPRRIRVEATEPAQASAPPGGSTPAPAETPIAEIPAKVSVAPLPASPAPGPSPPAAARGGDRFGPPATADPSLQRLLALAAEYVARYERVMSSAVLEERYVQLGKNLFLPPQEPDLIGLAWRDRDPTGGLTATTRERRQTRADVMLVKLPDGSSSAFRDVFEANGRTLRGRDERLRKLFLDGSADSVRQIRRIHQASADWNLGSFYREVNVPDLALAVFDARHARRFAFAPGPDLPGIDAGPACREVGFREVVRPTLVRSTSIDRPNVPLTGSACVDAAGRIWRTRLDLDEHYTARGVIEVTFAPADRVPVLVPDRMWEWYQISGARQARGQSYVEALARYSNLRLFSVTTTEDVK